MLQSSDSWRSALQNGHTDNGVSRGDHRLRIRSPTDDLMLDKPIVRLGRRGAAARIRSDTDPLGLHSAITDRETATRTRRRPSPATEDHGPTLEELLQRKTEARRQERLSEQRQLEIAEVDGVHRQVLTGSATPAMQIDNVASSVQFRFEGVELAGHALSIRQKTRVKDGHDVWEQAALGVFVHRGN
ncbi:hypothetical protein MRX96_011375 [Rhipicephalus microplus]